MGISWWKWLLLLGILMGLTLMVLRKMRTMMYEIEMLERRLNMEVEQVDRSLDWQNRQLSLALDYMERLHRGLIKNGSYVELPSAEDDERKYMHFIEERNRIRDGVRQRLHWNILRGKRPGGSYRELP